MGQLGEGHGAELFYACQRPNTLVAIAARNVSNEGRPRQKVHKLDKQR
jgi:hypothetical protein